MKNKENHFLTIAGLSILALGYHTDRTNKDFEKEWMRETSEISMICKNNPNSPICTQESLEKRMSKYTLDLTRKEKQKDYLYLSGIMGLMVSLMMTYDTFMYPHTT